MEYTGEHSIFDKRGIVMVKKESKEPPGTTIEKSSEFPGHRGTIMHQANDGRRGTIIEKADDDQIYQMNM
jgi:hypothetical protein